MKALLYIALTACVALCIGSCTRTLYVPVESQHERSDSVVVYDRSKEVERTLFARIDSIWQRDSIVQKQCGDTVYIEKHRERFHTSVRADTVSVTRNDTIIMYVATHDTIVKREPYPVEVVKEVPRQLSRWQSIRLWIGNVAVVVLFLAFGFGAWRLYRRLRR